MSHNQNNDIMKPTDYIEWDNLKNIPFFLCQVVEDKENKDIDIYYLGKRVFHYLQNIDLYHFLVNVIDYPVMGGDVSRPCNIPTAP